MAVAVFGDNPIGIIQGRLTHAGGQLQCFPYGKWKEEFGVAATVGFDCVEWILERENDSENPLWGAQGERPPDIMSGSDIRALSVCDDRVMSGRLFSEDAHVRDSEIQRLKRLMDRMEAMEMRTLVMPFLEGASLARMPERVQPCIELLGQLSEAARTHRVTMALEYDLPNCEVGVLCDAAPDVIGVCYDTGNRMAFGFDPSREIQELGPLIRHVHIKDRDAKGRNVMLGQGLVDFDRTFQTFKEVGYAGPFILETYRGKDDTREGAQNLAFVKECLRMPAVR